MAIKKIKEMSDGCNGEYWKIVAEHFDRTTKKCTWQIGLFKDHAACVAGKTPMGCLKTFTKTLTPEEAAGNRTQIGYAFIVAQANTKKAPLGNPLATPVFVDADLAEGENV